MGTLLFYYGYKNNNRFLMLWGYSIGLLLDFLLIVCFAKLAGKL